MGTGVRIRVFEKKLLRSKCVGERLLRLNHSIMEKSIEAEFVKLDLAPRVGHPSDVVSGSIEFWLAIGASPKPLEKDPSESCAAPAAQLSNTNDEIQIDESI